MRILKIRFKNLNSLVGEWSIDFTHPEYVENGIFAITGATGSGKSTLLDAICLALYARTPRLGRITKENNEILSRHTSECFSEVEFRSLKGHFRCHWSQRRARKKATGTLQTPKHEISELPDETVLAEKLKDVEKQVEAATGMNFGRFTRSMLLAQGQFAAFLQASPNERAPILEQITGTEIYSKISKKLYECASKENEKLKALQQEVEALQLFTEDEVARLEEEFATKQKDSQKRIQKVEALKKSLTWLKSLQSLTTEFLQLQKKWEVVEEEKIKNQPKLKQLAAAQKAFALEASYREVCSIRKTHEKKKLQLKECEKERIRLEPLWKESKTHTESVASKLLETRVAQELELQIIKGVRALDIKLQEQKNSTIKLERDFQKAQKQQQKHEQESSRLEELHVLSTKDQEELQLFLKEHANDASLIEHLTGIEQNFKILESLDQKSKTTQDSLSESSQRLKTLQKKFKKNLDAETKAQKYEEEQTLQLKQFADEMQAFLNNEDSNQWHDEIEDLKTRQHHWESLHKVQKSLKQTQKKLNHEKNEQQKFHSNAKDNETQLKASHQEEILLQQQIQNLEQKNEELTRVHALSKQRLALIEDHPCPLCGSKKHPYSQEQPAQPDANKLALKNAKKLLKTLTNKVEDLKLKAVALHKDQEHCTQEIKRLRMMSQEKNSESLELLKTLGCSSDEGPEENQIQLKSELLKQKELRKKLEEYQSKQKQEKDLHQKQEKAHKAFLKKTDQRKQSVHELEKQQEHQQRLSKDQEQNLKEKEQQLKQTRLVIEGYGITEFQIEKLTAILLQLRNRKSAWQKKLEQQKQIEEKLTTLAHQKERELDRLDKLKENLESQATELHTQKEQQALLLKQRYKEYGNKDTEQEERFWKQKVQNLEQKHKDSQELYIRRDKEHAELKVRRDALSSSILEGSQNLLVQEKRWMAERVHNGFIEESEFQNARLEKEPLETLQQWHTDQQKKETELQTRLKDKKEVLKHEQDKLLTQETPETLEELQESELKALEELQKEMHAITLKLKKNSDQQQEQKHKLEQIKVQKQEEEYWSTLNRLIGSADGKKFRNFAQGLTFEIMIAHANQQLQKMNDRYLLIHDDKRSLELNVIDDYQAGSIRSTKNLSGGEAFMVSLALALGLSRMASKNVRVDSLFLDEGFGSLDEESLATALQTLAGLQHDSTLIGVISHVAALKEQIPTQIRILPNNSGHSQIEGHGVNIEAA